MPRKSKTKAHTRYYLSNGTEVPGVTTVLQVLSKPALIHWAWELGMKGEDYRKTRDNLADVGTIAHYLVECELKGETPDLKDYSPDDIDLAENALIKFYEWQKQHTIEVIFAEQSLVSEQFKFGGTLDCLAYVDGVKTLLDFKTSKSIYAEHIIQLSAYLQLLRENNHPDVRDIRVLRIGRTEEEGYEEIVKKAVDLENHWKLFQHCLEIYRLRKVIGG
jgi:hypothetical protein